MVARLKQRFSTFTVLIVLFTGLTAPAIIFPAPQAQAITTSDCAQTVSVSAALTTSVVGNDCVLTFSADTTWTIPSFLTSVRILMVGGGAAGYNDGGGGGGGGGGYYNSSLSVTGGATANLDVGLGGSGTSISGGSSTQIDLTNNSSFDYSANGGSVGTGWVSRLGGAGGTSTTSMPGGRGGNGPTGTTSNLAAESGSNAAANGFTSDISGTTYYYGGGGGGGMSTQAGGNDSNAIASAPGGYGGGGAGAAKNTRGASLTFSYLGTTSASQSLVANCNANSSYSGATRGYDGLDGFGGGGGGGTAYGDGCSDGNNTWEDGERTRGGDGGDGVIIIRYSLTTPAQVTGLTATPGVGQVSLSWSAPANGGSAITDYVIEQSTDAVNYTTLSDGTSTSTSYTLTGLTNYTTYYYRIKATNAIGNSSSWSTAASATPYGTTDYSLDFDTSFTAQGAGLTAIPTADNAEFTVESWVWSDSVSVYDTIFTQGQMSSGQVKRFWMGFYYDNTDYFIHIGRSAASGGVSFRIPDPRGKWTHVAASVSSSNTVNVYLDGQLVKTLTAATYPGLANTGTETGIGIGGDDSGADNKFDGRIDQVKVWSGVLDQAELISSMHAWGKPASGVDNSVLSHWDFNDSSNTSTLKDKVGTAHLTLTSAVAGDYEDVAVTDTSINGQVIKTFKRTYLPQGGGWTIPDNVTAVRSLVVAGGGGGGADEGGGGGAGGFVATSSQSVSGTVQVKVGQGGFGGYSTSGTDYAWISGDGQSSKLDSVTAVGGGGGGDATDSGTIYNGHNGGSGGGGGGDSTPSSPGSGTAGQGYAGFDTNTNYGGGGGGAGGAATSITGGLGATSDITGTTLYYAAGGSGGYGNSAASTAAGRNSIGGVGGGSNGGATNGVANTGSGGGGGDRKLTDYVSLGGNGAPGVVIIRYTEPGAPSQVTGLAATAGLNQVALSWTAPSGNGNSITDYVIEQSTDNTSWTTVTDGVSTTASYTVTGLTTGQIYYFRVSAKNIIGVGIASSSANATPIPACSPTQSSVTVSGITYTLQTFAAGSTCSWTAPSGVTTVEYLAIGGGGGGGSAYDNRNAGGGGGGQVKSGNSLSTSGGLTISVGSGGAGGTVSAQGEGRKTTGTRSESNGTAGTNTTLANSSITVTSLGGSAGYNSRTYPGGAGFGGASGASSAAGGGNGGGGGGGGAAGAGSNGSYASPGAGGAGTASSITGSSVTYGKGGGAGTVVDATGAAGTSAGDGGTGAKVTSYNQWKGGAGANGVVIIRYQAAASFTSISPTAGSASGGTVTITGTNFASDSTATINGQALTISSISATQIVATVPAISQGGPYDLVITSSTGTITATGAYSTTSSVNVSFEELDFSASKMVLANSYSASATAVCTSSNETSNCIGKNLNDRVFYDNVITRNGVEVDAVVTTSTLSSATISKYEINTGASGNDRYFETDMLITSVGGYAEFTFNFYVSGTYVKATNSGTQVTLENINVTGFDIDYKQFTYLTGVNSYTAASGTYVTTNPSPVSTFPANITFQGRTGYAENDPKDQIVTNYATISNFVVRMGSNNASSSTKQLFGVAFKALSWGSSTPVTTGPVDAKVTLTYDDNGSTSGSVPSSRQDFVGTNITVSTNSGTLTKTNATFAGWNTAADGSGTSYAASSNFQMPNGGATLYAQWTVASFTVSYNANGGSGQPTDQSGSSGSSITLSSTAPTRSGYTFVGWNTAANGSGTSYSASSPFTVGSSNTTLYAQWTAIIYQLQYDYNASPESVSFDTNMPTSQSGSASSSQTVSSTVPLRTGYTFAGWNTAANGSGTSYASSSTLSMPVGGATLYAKWTANNYTVTYNANGGTGAPASTSAATASTVTVSSTVPTRSGYTFSGWLDAIPNPDETRAASSTFTMPSQAVTLVAQWTVVSYTLSYNNNTGSGTISSSTVNYGATASLDAGTNFNKSGYWLAGWASSSSATTADYPLSGTLVMPASNKTLYAVWIADLYDLTYSANGGSSAPADQTQSTGSSVNVGAASSRTGYTFAGWNTAANGSGTNYNANTSGAFTMPANNLVLYAKWTANSNSLVYNTNGGSSGPANETKSTDSTVTVSSTVPTRSGYTFIGWNTAQNGSGTTYTSGNTFTMPTDSTTTLWAQWLAQSFTVSYQGNGGITSLAAATYNTDATVSIAVGDPTRTGYTFAGWTDNAGGTGTVRTSSSNSSFTMPANNVVYYAKWTLTDFTVTYDRNTGSGTAPSTETGLHYQVDTVEAANPVRLSKTGYTFAGWNTAANGSGTSYNAGSTFLMPAEDVTLYAQWDAVPYSVIYNATGGSNAPANQSARSGVNVTVSAQAPTRSGYRLQGWKDASGNDYDPGDSLTMPSSNVILFAQWEAEASNGNSGGNSGGGSSTTATPTPTPSSSATSNASGRRPPNLSRPSQSATPSPSTSATPNNVAPGQIKPTPAVSIPALPGLSRIVVAPDNTLGVKGTETTRTVDFGEGIKTDKEISTQTSQISSSSGKRSLSEISAEKLSGFAPGVGTRIEVIGARTGARFVIADNSQIDSVTMLAAIQNSIPAQKQDFTQIQSVTETLTPVVPEEWTEDEREYATEIFAASGLSTPIALTDLYTGNYKQWLRIETTADTYLPGSRVFLTVTSTPLVLGTAIVDKNGEVQVVGDLPVDWMVTGEHKIRIVGIRSLDGVYVDENGEVQLADETLSEIKKFDLGTQATITVVGQNTLGGEHAALRIVPLIPVAPWWTLLILLVTSLIVGLLHKKRKLVNRKQKLIAVVVLGVSGLPAVILGWISTVTLVTWIGLLLTIAAVAIFWMTTNLNKKRH